MSHITRLCHAYDSCGASWRRPKIASKYRLLRAAVHLPFNPALHRRLASPHGCYAFRNARRHPADLRDAADIQSARRLNSKTARADFESLQLPVASVAQAREHPWSQSTPSPSSILRRPAGICTTSWEATSVPLTQVQCSLRPGVESREEHHAQALSVHIPVPV